MSGGGKGSRRRGWERTDPRPWGKCSARYEHERGGVVAHCGHPTANHPWDAWDPDGRVLRAPNGRAFRLVGDAQAAVELASVGAPRKARDTSDAGPLFGGES